MTINLLQNRTWRDLRVTARAYQLRFNNNFTKAEAADFLHRMLIDEGWLRRAINRLSETEHEALMALKAQHGRIKRWRFTQAYGHIRRYRPWLPHALPHPWRRPVSTAEKLWFLGLIEVDKHQAVLLPDAVSRLLPPVPHPQTAVWSGPTPDLDSGAIVRDVAALLGTLLHTPVRLLHGRWLPPYTLKAINQRVSQPEDMTGIRSEFQCRRTRFLHYLARAAGLVSVQNGVLLPTAEARIWLSLPYKAAHQTLVEAVTHDLHTRHPLWEQFRLPPVSTPIWDALLAFPPATYTVGSVSENIRLKTLEPNAGTHIRAALLGPLRWLGMGTVNLAAILIAAPSFSDQTAASLHMAPDSIGITLPSAPSLPALVELLAYATVDDLGLRLDQSSLAHAVESGQNAAHVAQTLVALTGQPLPREILDRLSLWEHAAQQVRIRHITVLEIANTGDMQAIRSDWRLRSLMGEQLSPRHVVVRDERLLRQRLKRRGYPLPLLRDRNADPLPRTNTNDPAYLWVAARLCQALSSLIPLPVYIPGTTARSLEHELGERLDALQGLVDRSLDQVRSALRGHVQSIPYILQSDPERIREMIEKAVALSSAVRIRYFSPYAGHETERTIEPELIYERSGATYIEAWCNLDDAPRTFRLDRILAVM